MDKNKNNRTQWVTTTFLGLFVLTFVSISQAEERRGRGVISAVFHENEQNRNKSDYFYVTKEEGETYWRNYKEQEETPEKNRPLFVYEIREKKALPLGLPPQEPSDVARIENSDIQNVER